MWRLFRAELAGPLRDLAVSSGFGLLGLATFLVAADSDALVMRWGVSGLVGLPLFVNFTARLGIAKQNRVHLHAVLPLTRCHISLVYLVVPMVIQLLGGLLGVALVVCQRWTEWEAGNWEYPAVLSCALLLVGQWLTLQRELLLRNGDRPIWAVIAGLVLTLVIALPLAAVYLGLRSFNDRFADGQTISASWVGPVVLLAVTALVFFINLQLILRRDPVAE